MYTHTQCTHTHTVYTYTSYYNVKSLFVLYRFTYRAAAGY